MSMSIIYVCTMAFLLTIGMFTKEEERKNSILLLVIALSMIVIGFTIIEFYEVWLRILHLMLNPTAILPPGVS
jgi:hypothetical protein